MITENRTREEIVGDTILDLGKLTYAGIVLAGIFDSSLNNIILVSGGLLFCTILLIIGIYLKTRKKRKNNYGIFIRSRRNDFNCRNRNFSDAKSRK